MSEDLTGAELRALKPADLLAQGLVSETASDETGLRDELFSTGALALATQCHDGGVPIDALHLSAIVLHRVAELGNYGGIEQTRLKSDLAVQSKDLAALAAWTDALGDAIADTADVRAAQRLFEKASSLYALRQALRPQA
ncbi:MAG: hypothetical protein KC912_19835 [Proteobacteria bacterium]|nr:hypothetical protein [Pseudomonadota bacterium]